ncbi:putative transposable element [Pseudoloma neurophilia]|uniref:Putative transposable element n=1 Tax=Pseudoloma neurophilia TaxID=146866 RepID=A0A0R0LX02_9MICR|nr:putative transposable element [Pseudoloma neurophilia]
MVICDQFVRMTKENSKPASESSNILISSNSTDQPIIDRTMKFLEEIARVQPKIGEIRDITHKIVTRDHKPIQLSQYRTPHDLYEKTWAEINLYLKEGIIRKGKGKWSAPAYPILKKNGSIRLIVDYRALNAITEDDPHPCPSVADSFAHLKGSSVFSTIDLNKGYYQVNIEESDKEKTGFVILGSHYEFNRMPMGLSTAPKTFSKVALSICEGLSFAVAYLDDILVHSPDINSHSEHLRRIIKRIQELGGTINFSKSTFFTHKLTYLGREVSEIGIQPDLTALKKLLIYEKPTKKKHLEKILGTIN